jgi:tight adherence protein C
MAALLDIVIQLLTFGVAAMVGVAATQWLWGAVSVRRRLAEQPGAGFQGEALIKQGKVEGRFLQWVEGASLADKKERTALQQQLALAGFEQPSAPVFYVLFRFAAAIGLPLLFLGLQQLSAKPATGLGAVMAPLILCAVGFLGPNRFIQSRATARQNEIEDEFPDALDLTVVCVEAGLGMEAAFVRVGDEVRESHPRIAEEFGRMAQEMAAGRSRADALRALADRAHVEMVRSFVALMIQTETLGVSVGQTLRTFATEMREHRYLRAEQKAMRIPVLMTIPLVACILPVIVAVALLPAAIDVVRTVLPALRGQGAPH